MLKTFCLLNHVLTQNQISELLERFASNEIIYPDKELSALWAQISPEDENQNVVEKVVDWLESFKAGEGDLFIVQGEFGATFTLVDFALKNGLVPIYATTKRVEKETRNGEKVKREYIFEHVKFKKYKYY